MTLFLATLINQILCDTHHSAWNDIAFTVNQVSMGSFYVRMVHWGT